jgi:hypothetical protein
MKDVDDAIEEIRRARYEISARYKDVYAYVGHLMRAEARRAKQTEKRAGGAAQRAIGANRAAERSV